MKRTFFLPFTSPRFTSPVLEIQYAPLHSYSSLANRGFLYETGFLPGFKFSTSHLFVLWVFFWFSLHTWNRGKCGEICTNIFTSKTLKRGWLRHRLPRLVTYATWISLLRRMVASQQQTFLPIDFDFVVTSRCVAANFSILEIFEIKRPPKWWLSRTVFKHSSLYQKSHSFAALTRSITDTSTTRALTPYTRTFHELFSM